MSTDALTAAEQAVIGSAMASTANARDAAALIAPDDWHHPRHALIWAAITKLAADGITPDPTLVLLELEANGTGNRAGGAVYLADCWQRAAVAGSIEHFAQIVADAATVRRVSQAGQRIAQRAETPGVDPTELVAWSAEQVAAARNERKGVDVLTSTYDDFVHSTPEDRPMVIPGLLGEGDRLVLTGHGGLGKSTMLQQIAVCAAAGLPPFDWAWTDGYAPVRVSILDFENPDHRVKTRLWPMVNDCLKLGADPRPNLTVGGRGNPLNLLNPQNALSLLRTVEHDAPKLVYIGPVYKMHNDDPDKESVIKKITDVLDSIRAMGVSIITEAHHTKEGRKGGSLEPSGSNLWTWWPEFGLGLRMADGPDNLTRRCALEKWRIDRESNEWPHEVESSGQAGLVWARCAAPGWREVA